MGATLRLHCWGIYRMENEKKNSNIDRWTVFIVRSIFTIAAIVGFFKGLFCRTCQLYVWKILCGKFVILTWMCVFFALQGRMHYLREREHQSVNLQQKRVHKSVVPAKSATAIQLPAHQSAKYHHHYSRQKNILHFEKCYVSSVRRQ